MTWSSSTGNVRIYVDGELGKKFSNIAKGSSIPAKGTVVLGQDQDSLGGGFSTAQAYTGKLYGVYVWKRVLDEGDIFNFANDCKVR